MGRTPLDPEKLPDYVAARKQAWLLAECDQEVNGQPQAIAYIQAGMRAAVRVRRS